MLAALTQALNETHFQSGQVRNIAKRIISGRSQVPDVEVSVKVARIYAKTDRQFHKNLAQAGLSRIIKDIWR